MKLFFISLILSFFIIKSIKDDYELLYEWGKNNSVFISYKISMNYTNSNTKNFYVNEKIDSGELIMSIPKNVILNVNTALKLSGSKIRTQYDNYVKEKFDGNMNIYEVKEDRLDHSFLAYLMTVANKKKSKKNKFYKHFKYFLNTFETNVEYLPPFYNSQQIKLLMFSLIGKGILQTKSMIEEEHKILETNIYKNFLDIDEYMKYRIFTYKKLVDTSNLNGLVPFVDILDKNPINFNLQLNYSLSEGVLYIYAIQDIEQDDKLILYTNQMPNIKSFLMYGDIYEENKDFIEIFRIPLISSVFIKENNLDPELNKGDYLDLEENKYYEKTIPLYMKLTKIFNKDESKVSALSIFLENIKEIRKTYEKVNLGILFEHFYKNEYVEKILSLLDTEKRYLDKKIKEIKDLINQFAGEDNELL